MSDLIFRGKVREIQPNIAEFAAQGFFTCGHQRNVNERCEVELVSSRINKFICG